MIRTIEMPILHREIAEFLDPRIHEAAPGTPSFALHGFRIDDREYVMDCLPTTGLLVGYRIVETGELVSALQCDKGVSEEKQLFRALLSAACGKYLATKRRTACLPCLTGLMVILSASISSTKTLRHDAGCLAARLLSSGPAMPSSDSRQKCG